MVFNAFCLINLFGVCCTLSLRVRHNIAASELLDVVERSWKHNDVPIEDGDFNDADEITIFLLKPFSINSCSKNVLEHRLKEVLRGDELIADDPTDPSLIIGQSPKVQDYLQHKAVKMNVNSEIVYPLIEELTVGMTENNSFYNYETKASPCILSTHGGKLNLLFRFANYIPSVNSAVTWSDSYNWHGNCHICSDIQKVPKSIEKKDMVVIAGFIFQWTPLLFNWLNSLLNQEVKAQKFYIIYNNITEHDEVIKSVVNTVGFDGLVLDHTFFKDKDVSDIRGHSAVMCSALDCSYLFTVDSEVALLRNNIITHLVQFNKSVITAPVTTGRERSNFWGDITEKGWYRRSPDYFDIIDGAWGLFVVPYIKSMYLTRSDALPDYQGHGMYSDSDTDMAMCANYRNKTTLMWLVSTLNCAIYTDMTLPDVSLPLPDSDLYAAASNWHSWVDFSLNKEVAFSVLPVDEFVGGCSDENLVLPLFTEVYCAAFTKAFLSYTWSQSSVSKVQTLPVTELRYHVIVEGVLSKGVLPYIKQQFGIETDLTILHEEMTVFIQHPNMDTELHLTPRLDNNQRAFYVVWFWTDNPEQGINFLEESCKVHLPPGSLLVLEDKGQNMIDLITADSRNVGIYTRVYA